VNDHWNFNCRVSGQIYDLEPQDTEAPMAVGANRGAFRVDSRRGEFFGECANRRS
jgi:Fur family peroxide stress response transcriptional regulator